MTENERQAAWVANQLAIAENRKQMAMALTPDPAVAARVHLSWDPLLRYLHEKEYVR